MENVRLNFVLSAKNEQHSFKEICDSFGITAKTGYKWLNRYNNTHSAALRRGSGIFRQATKKQ